MLKFLEDVVSRVREVMIHDCDYQSEYIFIFGHLTNALQASLPPSNKLNVINNTFNHFFPPSNQIPTTAPRPSGWVPNPHPVSFLTNSIWPLKIPTAMSTLLRSFGEH